MKTVVYTREETVSCDGYDEVQQEATHPKVYYTLKKYKDGEIKAACHYCGKLYLYKDGLDNHNRINIQSLESNDILE
jgi:uncharacterized Zn-finger protein